MADKIVLVKYKKGFTVANADALESVGAQVVNVYKNINWVSVNVPAENVDKLKALSDIEIVEDDQEAHILIADIQLVPALEGQIIPYGISKIRAPEVWPENNDGSWIKWCVIDTGVARLHPDLAANIHGGQNYINSNDDFEDDNGHGTHVSGIIAALNNDIGVVGVAPNIGLYAYKVLDKNGSGKYSDIVSAIDDAISNGMQGINMSLGGSAFSQALKDACSAAYAAGIVIVAAAGNSGGDGSQDTVLYPARFSEYVIAVAATDINDVHAPFSSCGTEVEVSAPGVSVISTVPTSGGKLSDPSGYMSASGTSMSAPHVSGAAALIMAKHEEFKPADIRAALDSTAVHLGDPGKNVFYGFGRIDAKAAVDRVIEPVPALTKISITPQTASPMVGSTQKFQVTALDKDNKPMPSVVILWSVSDSVKGYVNPITTITGPDGTGTTTLTALSPGNVVLKASNDVGDITASATVTITEITPTPGEKKFRVQLIGIPGHMIGVTVTKWPFGADKTGEEACKEVCDLLKTM